MFPFYQNYFDYYNSVFWPELMGKSVKGLKLYKSKCAKGVRETAEGTRISPCGIQAKAFFNDTFKIEGIPLSETNIAWPSDVERFQNPKGYPEPQNASWLYERFGTISEAAGVTDEHFVRWVRPDAYAEVRKPYAHINQKLSKGQNITVLIDNRFPVSQLKNKVRKELVLTTLSAFGARDETLARFLLATGCGCMLVSIIICSIEGLSRFYQSDED